jgi:uncharacterized protein HemX
LLSTETVDDEEEGRAMTENNKPEWFEITDADEKPELRKVSKSLPVSAVLVVALILGVGVVLADTQNETPASAISASAEQTTASNTNPTATPDKSNLANPTTAAGVRATTATKLVNPSISKLPTGGDDDDDHDDRGRSRDHGDDDDDEEGDDD